MQAPSVGVALSWMLFSSLMIVAAFVDLDTMTIPNRCSVGGFAIGLMLSMLVPELHSAGRATVEPFTALILSLKGAFIGTALIYWIMSLANLLLRRNTMGLGDVELLGAIGAFCGWQGAVFALFGGAMLGTLAMVSWAGARLILGKGLPEIPTSEVPKEQGDPEEEVPEGAIPFGPALASGAVCYILFARDIVTNYFDQMEFLLMR
jgi:leader peptidase (prepilin peptidase)/N-methyltransferase